MFTYKYFDKAVYNRKLILFGAGEGAARNILYLDRYEIAYICDNDQKKWGTKLMDILIRPPSVLLAEERQNIIVFITSCYGNEISLWLIEHEIAYLGSEIFLSQENDGTFKGIDKNHIVWVNKHYILERCSRRAENRKMLIYGTGAAAEMTSRMLSIYDIDAEYYLDDEFTDNVFENKSVRSCFDIVFEKKEDIFIIIAHDKESYGVSRQKFIQLGLVENVDFTYWLYNIYREDICISTHFDVTLGYSRIKSQQEGFELFGDTDNPEALKIVALGGSTTESTYCNVKGWAQYLAERFAANHISTAMYCGGVSGYQSSQELLKLIRDVLPLQPNVVLSYSGYNDLYHYHGNKLGEYPSVCRKRPFIHEYQVKCVENMLSKYSAEERIAYYGLENDKKAPEIWLDNIRAMYAIAKEFNISFFSFLQPFRYNDKSELSKFQSTVFSRIHWCWHDRERLLKLKFADSESVAYDYRELQAAIKDIGYITDLTNIFFDCADVIYRDQAHVTERGNEIIAENIYQVLLKHLF